jgi:hypothetical protein
MKSVGGVSGGGGGGERLGKAREIMVKPIQIDTISQFE